MGVVAARDHLPSHTVVHLTLPFIAVLTGDPSAALPAAPGCPSPPLVPVTGGLLVQVTELCSLRWPSTSDSPGKVACQYSNNSEFLHSPAIWHSWVFKVLFSPPAAWKRNAGCRNPPSGSHRLINKHNEVHVAGLQGNHEAECVRATPCRRHVFSPIYSQKSKATCRWHWRFFLQTHFSLLQL